ncbi:uncharacterized protein LOC118225319 isoform X3 [Anguilla anguilla]|uniref:uncharacterized protein LOC118225319 isoform X3 n=1 Tax=Anguilla anguilla TaxID=7936 RepID=UPI0015A81865|nr:uncharacterized protein LOC118225319 isoform X3 [Anguilla anguilla]
MHLASRSTVEGSPIKETSRNISIGPFTNPEDLAWRTVQMKDNNDPEEGFMIITFKKRQSLKPAKYLFQKRLKWSSELERVPTLDNLSKGSSQAQIGGALSYTDTTHWYSSSTENHRNMPVSAFTEEQNGRFSLSGSIGKLVGQQLLHGNVVRIGINGNYKSGRSPERNMSIQALGTVVQEDTSELVSLSITDELEKRNAKILTPRSHSAYLSLPIVSETYPVVLHADHRHKPFSSPGFHSVSPGRAVYQTPGQRVGKFHSAIIRITQSLQEQHLGRGVRERLWMERELCTKEENHSGQSQSPVRQVVGIEGVGVYGVSFHLSKANISAEYKDLKETPATRGTPVHAPPSSPVHPYDLEIHLETMKSNTNTPVSAKDRKCLTEAEGEGRDFEGAVKTIFPLDQQQAISIPTAKTM